MYETAIVDAPYLTRRAWGISGAKVEAVAGSVLATLLMLHRQFQPTEIVFVWEGDNQWRRDIFPGYKAGRENRPPDYLAAIMELQLILPCAGVVQATCDGEADDAAKSITCQWEGPHLLWTADKDWYQMVQPGVDLYRPDTSMRPKDVPPEQWQRPPGRLITAYNIVEETGLDRHGWHTVLTLVGGKDDVPGVPGIGDVKAKRLQAACPGIVDLLLSDVIDERSRGHGAEDVLRIISQTDSGAIGLAELVTRHAERVVISSQLVRLLNLPLLFMPATTGPDDIVAMLEWFGALGLEHQAEQLAALLNNRN